MKKKKADKDKKPAAKATPKRKPNARKPDGAGLSSQDGLAPLKKRKAE